MAHNTLRYRLVLASMPAIAIATAARADTCPLSSTSVDANVQSSVAFDVKTKLYTYSYTVQNLKSSPLNIKRFLVIANSDPQNPKSPNNWDADFYPDNNGRMDWSTYLPDPNAKDDPNGPSVDPAFYALKPGQSLSGFSFQSPNPPAQTRYMVAGDTVVPKTTATTDNDEPVPNCPGWDFDGPKYETMNTGITQGPSDPNVLSVVIRMRGDENGKRAVPIDPVHAKGKVGVLIPSTKSFDASTVDTASIVFGPAKVAPLSSRLVPSRKDELEDELEEWEKMVFGRAFNDRQEDAKERVKRKSLFMLFDVQALGIRCVLDHALFLTGKTKDGKAISGGVSIKTVGCDTKKPGKKEYLRRHHAFYLPPIKRSPAEIAARLAHFQAIERIQKNQEHRKAP